MGTQEFVSALIKLDKDEDTHLVPVRSGNGVDESKTSRVKAKDERNEMQEKALGYLDYFELELTGEGMVVTLAEDAPHDLQDLARVICGPDQEGLLVCLYEALTCVAEAETPEHCAIDEKVCPIDTFQTVVEALRRER